jgi:hypothetical protein
MPGRLRILVAWAAIAAWAAASGLTWDLLQVAAWVNMSADNARTMSAGAAVAKTMTDESCPLCRAAAEGRAQSEQSPLTKQDPVKAKEKSDASLPWVAVRIDDRVGWRLAPDESRAALPSLAREVPVPPPKPVV